MAKKKTVEATAPEQEQVAGRGKKKCVSCGSFIGARSRECPNCKAEQPVKGSGVSSGASSPKKLSQQTLTFGDMLETLARVKELTEILGGIEEAEKVLNQVKALTDDCGSFQELVQAVKLTDKL